MGICSLSVMAHMVTLNMHHMHSGRRVPRWLQRLTRRHCPQSWPFTPVLDEDRLQKRLKSQCLHISEISNQHANDIPKRSKNNGIANAGHNPADALFLHLKSLSNKMDLSQTEKAMQEEWKMAACAVDRWLLIIFLIIQLIMFIAAFVIIPNLWSQCTWSEWHGYNQ